MDCLRIVYALVVELNGKHVYPVKSSLNNIIKQQPNMFRRLVMVKNDSNVLWERLLCEMCYVTMRNECLVVDCNLY